MHSRSSLPRHWGLLPSLLLAASLVACDSGDLSSSTGAVAAASERHADGSESRNARLLGHHDLQGRSAYQPVVHAYGERQILFVGHHAGEALNPDTGVTEVNGLSILDVTDPGEPTLLTHLPPSGLEARGTQHVQVCDGRDLPAGDPAKVYMVRTNGNLAYEMFDVTDPAKPLFMSTIAETGDSSRPDSARGIRETHKLQWECSTGLGLFNGTAEGWRVTRVLQAFDLGNPESPRHIRDFGLVGYEPTAEGPYPPRSVSGLHQPFAHGDYIYVGYGSGNEGTLQILDREKFLNGDPAAADPMAPTRENLLYPEVGRLDMPSFWGVHTAKPLLDIEVPGYRAQGSRRDFLLVPSEAEPGSMLCQGVRDIVFLIDITEREHPYPASSFQVPADPGGYCDRGGRFGPHSVQDDFHPGFDKTLMVLSYFNAGVRVVDVRNPFAPVEVAYYVPAVTDNTIESCTRVDGVETCLTAVQTNNVNIDSRGLIYAVDRANTGLHIIELTGEARAIAGLGEG